MTDERDPPDDEPRAPGPEPVGEAADGDEIEPPLHPSLAVAWSAAAPPASFVDQVLRAREQDAADAVLTETRAVRRRLHLRGSRWRFGGAIAGLVAVGVVLVVGSLWRGRGHPSGGVVAATERATVRLGNRGAVVAEPGARLRWRVDERGAGRVEQSAGTAFYRIEPGGPFVVSTPAGEAEVLGTCFRVEVTSMKPSVAGLAGAVAGAAVGALVVVSVYEGRVFATSDQGRVLLRPGQSATLRRGAAPVAGAPSPAGALALPSPAATATREELLARDRAQRQEIAALRLRVAALEQSAGRAAAAALGPDRGFFEASKEDLVAMAQRCEVRFDSPPVFGIEAPTVDPRLAASLGLTGPERLAMAAALKDIHARFAAQVRSIYVSMTGDAKGAASLAPDAMGREIEDKSPKGSADIARRRLALERAGLAAPPAPDEVLSPAERYLRLVAALGDEYERRLGEAIGPARAHELRAARHGWPNRMALSGCPGDEESPGQ